jgi:hypothetical protein
MTAAEMIAKEPEAMRKFLSEQPIGGLNRREKVGTAVFWLAVLCEFRHQARFDRQQRVHRSLRSDFPLQGGHRETT